MIEIESAQVVLVGLALAAVLADDDARHRLEHLAGTHHRPGVELTAGDGALAGGLGDPDQVGGRVERVGQVGERAFAGDRDIGAEHQVKRGVGGDGAGGGHRDVAPHAREVGKREGDLDGPWRGGFEHVVP